MTDIEVGGHQYRIGRLPAKNQFHIVRRLAPALSSLADMAGDENRALGALAQAVGGMTDADADYVLFGLLRVVSRKQPGGGWAPVAAGDVLAYDDISMPDMIRLAVAVFQGNFGDFFAALPQVSADPGSAQKGR